MDPPQTPPSAATPAAVSSAPTSTTNTNPPHLPASNSAAAPTYPESMDSSPRSRTTDSYIDDPPLLSSKLRLMCSFGGHIVPRPHDKSLCYIGGDTRIVVVDRHITLSSLSSRLSNTLLNGRAFILKYQLPSEDLDSLISVTTDEDLENMIDEYDRTNSNAVNSGKPSRLRLFLFPLKPDSSQSIGPILESSGKSEDWFFNALNGANGLLNRGFSDSASVNCLLGLDDDNSLNGNSNGDLVGVGVRDVEALQKNNGKTGQDVHSVPDSPMLENSSSFGSTSSSPSLANLPPIRVRVEDGGGAGGTRGVLQDQKVAGIEEQFAQISVSGGGGGVLAGQIQDDGFMAISSPPPMPVSLAISGVPVGPPVTVAADYQNRLYPDDDRSDHGVPVGYKKPPPPQSQPLPQPVVPQTQQKPSSGGAIELPSPDSVSSDNSLSSAVNRPKPMIYQDQVQHIPAGISRVTSNPVDPKMNVSDPNPRVQNQQVQDSGYALQPQFEQLPQQPQQFIHAGTHYFQHHPASGVPMSAYYSVYPPQQQHHIQHHPQLDQQYPVYYVQTRQPPQPYNFSSIQEPTPTVPSTRSQTPPNPQATYNHPMRNAPMAQPEMTNSGMYRTAATGGAPQLVQVSSNQHQQQYVGGYSQVHHPSQSGTPAAGVGVPANYGYEFADPSQIYYSQPIPSHYQTMTAAGAVVLPESSQLPNDNIKQQTRTSQPI